MTHQHEDEHDLGHDQRQTRLVEVAARPLAVSAEGAVGNEVAVLVEVAFLAALGAGAAARRDPVTVLVVHAAAAVVGDPVPVRVVLARALAGPLAALAALAAALPAALAAPACGNPVPVLIIIPPTPPTRRACAHPFPARVVVPAVAAAPPVLLLPRLPS